MTTNTLDKIHAVAPSTATRLTYIPVNLDPHTLVGVLHRLGLMVPTKLSAAASSRQPLQASGHRYTIGEIDAALSKANAPVSDRFRVKAAMGQNGILER
jgi:hypothetical protein